MFYFIVGCIAWTIIITLVTCRYTNKLAKRWRFESVAINGAVFDITTVNLRTNIPIIVQRDWKSLRGTQYPTLGYIDGVFSQLEEKYKGQLQFIETPYTEFSRDDEERIRILSDSLKIIENHVSAAETDIVLQFLGLELKKTE